VTVDWGLPFEGGFGFVVDPLVGVDELVEFALELGVGDLVGGILVFEFVEWGSLGVVGSDASDLFPAPRDPAREDADNGPGHGHEIQC